MIALRQYQQRGFGRVIDLFTGGCKRVLLVLPTGGGKTVLSAALIRHFLEAHARRSIFFAHRKELIKNTFCKLVRDGLPPETVGVIMAGVEWRASRNMFAEEDLTSMNDRDLWNALGRRRPQADTQVASIDTFRNRTKPPAGVIVFDEAHRSYAKSYRDVQAAYPDAWHLGLTATPFREGGQGLIEMYDEIVVVATYLELVADLALVEPTAWGTKLRADLTKVRKSGDDYNRGDLALAVNKSELIGDIIETWRAKGNDQPTLCFCVDVAHSQAVAERFNAAGIPAVHVDGNTDDDPREDAIRALYDGRVKVVCNCDVFSEGTDIPIVKTIIHARPTQSERLAMQQAGRGSRPCGRCSACSARPRRACLTPFVIIDHARVWSNPHFGGLPQEAREYTLEGRKKKKGTGAKPVKECPGCLALVPAAKSVCDCGYVFTEEEEGGKKGPKEKDGELVELKPGELGALNEFNAIVTDWRWRNVERDARKEAPLPRSWIKGEWKRRHGTFYLPRGSKMPEAAL